MHEMGIALEIVSIATSSIPPDLMGSKVERVNLQVGKFSAVLPDSLRFCFEAAAMGTPLEDAELFIEEISIEVKCDHCCHQWSINEPLFLCPACGSGSVDILSGRELNIKSIEINDKEN
jgi:hydrogenase nickel incorporation protein HypA/HybF